MPIARPVAFPIPALTVALACLAYALLGLTGHDPWKNADAIAIGTAYGLTGSAESGTTLFNWLVPHLAGEVWTQTPPLYFWLGAFLADLLSPILPIHSGIRLTSAIFTLAGLYFLSLAARGFHGREAGLIAPLLAIGSLGLLVPAHDAQPALIGFASLAGILAALAWWEVNPRKSAVAIGCSMGIGFAGTGLDSLAMNLGIVAAALVFPSWRRVSRSSWWLAFFIAAVLCAAWPLALYRVAPELLSPWWSSEVARLLISQPLSMRRIELLLWGTWPVLPFAAWTVWLNRRQLLVGRHAVPMIATLLSLVLYAGSDDANEAALPVIASLVVLASAGCNQLRRGAASAFDWFGSLSLSIFMGLIWLAAIAMLTGSPARVAKNFIKPAPGFVAEFSPVAMMIAILATGFWIYILVRTPRSPWRAASRWSLGIVCLWALLVTLLMPWIDYGKSYRQLASTLQSDLGKDPGCIVRQELGASQRASLDYFAGIRTVPAESKECPFLLLQTSPGTSTDLPGWQLVRETYRAGDRRERLRLYRRAP